MCCRPCRLSALGWSTWFTTRMRGRLPSAAYFHTRSVTASAPACAFTTTSAASTGSIAARVSCRNMWNPGVSSRLIFTPFHSTNAAALAIVVRRATSSSSYAVTAEPSSTCPCVLVIFAACSSAAIKVVLPLCAWPTTATFRTSRPR